MTNDLLTARELAKRLGPTVSPATLYRMAARKLIPSVAWGAKKGGRRFVENEVRIALTATEKQLRAYHPPRRKGNKDTTA
jgi:hypothetical protein